MTMDSGRRILIHWRSIWITLSEDEQDITGRDAPDPNELKNETTQNIKKQLLRQCTSKQPKTILVFDKRFLTKLSPETIFRNQLQTI